MESKFEALSENEDIQIVELSDNEVERFFDFRKNSSSSK